MNDPDLQALLFDLDGHVTDLSLDRLLYEPLEADASRALEAHFERCGECRARLEQIRAQDAAVSFAPPASLGAQPFTPLTLLKPEGSAPRPASAWRWRQIGARVGGLLAMAAVLALFMRPGAEREPRGVTEPAPDEIRLKGSLFEMEVYADDRPGGRLLEAGSMVYPGIRLGFRVRAREAGRVMIVGWDQLGEIYPCWPDDGPTLITASPAGDPGDSGALTRGGEPQTVDGAVVLDDTLGTEHLIGVHCVGDFTWADLKAALRSAGKPNPTAQGAKEAPTLPETAGRCSWEWITLNKQALKAGPALEGPAP